MILDRWARKWEIKEAALIDLKNQLGVIRNSIIKNTETNSEAAIVNKIRIEATQKGARLWRNNLGAVHTNDGRFVRFGFANESSAVNKIIKSSDLIGIKPIKITNDLIGATIGQFVSREVKASDWEFKGTEREMAQLKWIELITSLGGDACFATKVGTL